MAIKTKEIYLTENATTRVKAGFRLPTVNTGVGGNRNSLLTIFVIQMTPWQDSISASLQVEVGAGVVTVGTFDLKTLAQYETRDVRYDNSGVLPQPQINDEIVFTVTCGAGDGSAPAGLTRVLIQYEEIDAPAVSVY